MSIFEQASRKKLRFLTDIGSLSVEDLWELPLTSEPVRGRTPSESLNHIAIGLHHDLQSSTVSFVDVEPTGNHFVKLRFDIVKHIIDVRIAENKEAHERAAKSERKQKLLAILSRKEDAALESMSQEEIRALIDQT